MTSSTGGDGRTETLATLRTMILPVLMSLFGTIIALFPSNPTNMLIPSRDSGVFLYVGWRLLSGDVPYRDVWDHKPPLIYFVDALGLSMTPNSLWGVWLIQAIFIFATFLVLYRLLEKEFNSYAAIAGSLLFASGLLTILERGNVTEEYALLFQAVCFLLIARAAKFDFPPQWSFWIGIAGGLAFNFKQTTIGILIAYGLFILLIRLSQRRFPLRDFGMLFVGWSVPSLLVVVYFASQSALADFWEQAYRYNFFYIGKHEGIRRLIPVFTKGFLYLQNGYILQITILGWLSALAYAWSRRKNFFVATHPLIIIALIDLPIEVMLITASGRSILHYYLTPLPVIALLTGVLIYTLPRLLDKISRLQKFNQWTPAFLLAVIVLLQYGQVQYYPEYVRALSTNSRVQVIDYISANTDAGDKVLIIGAESVVNFLARRESPTRYVYQYPLALTGSRPMFEEYFNQILENDPVLIIDTRGRESLTEKLYEPLQKRSEIVRAGVEYLGMNYEKVAQFGEWIVYRKIDS